MKLTIFNDVRAQIATERELTWPEFAHWVENPGEYRDKQSCPLIKLATVGNTRTAAGSLRHDANIESVWGIEGDYDGGEVSPELASYMLRSSGIKGAIYTSPSHTEEKPRWRVIVPFEKEHHPAERRVYAGALNGVLGGILAKESFTLSQSYYFGKVNGSHQYKAFVLPGQAIDCIQLPVPVYPVGVTSEREYTKKEYEPISDKTFFELAVALTYISSADYMERIAVGQALSGLGDQGHALYEMWHNLAEREFAHDSLSKWHTFTGERTGYQSIFVKAEAYGWINPARGQHNTLDPKKFKFNQEKFVPPAPEEFTFTSGDELAINAAPPKYLIDKIITQDSHGMLAAQSMAFKSFMALEMAHCIATGRDFYGHKVKRKGKVIYICGEGKGGLASRIKALTIKYGPTDGNLLILDQFMFIDNAEMVKRLALTVQREKPALVIFDTLSSLNNQTDENSNSEVAHVLATLKSELSNGITSTMIIHHFGKDVSKGTRGASAFLNNADYVMTMERAEGDNLATLHCKKSKDGPEFTSITVEAETVGLGFYDDDMQECTSLVLVKSDKFTEVDEPIKWPKHYRQIYSILEDKYQDEDINKEDVKDIVDEVYKSAGVSHHRKYTHDFIKWCVSNGKVSITNPYFIKLISVPCTKTVPNGTNN